MQRLLLAGLIVCACATLAPGEAPPAPIRVLFIGNSLTYANDLPAMIEAAAGGNARVETRERPKPGSRDRSTI